MTALDRPFFSVYVKDHEVSGRCLLHGTLIEHSYQIGTFDDNGKQARLFCVQLSKELLEDFSAEYKESCDFPLTSLDSDEILPIAKHTFTDNFEGFMEEVEKIKSILVKPIVAYDLSQNKTMEDILESRIVLFLPQFLGFKLEDVFVSFPEIEIQARAKDENGDFIISTKSYPVFDENNVLVRTDTEENFVYSILPCKPIEDL